MDRLYDSRRNCAGHCHLRHHKRRRNWRVRSTGGAGGAEVVRNCSAIATCNLCLPFNCLGAGLGAGRQPATDFNALPARRGEAVC